MLATLAPRTGILLALLLFAANAPTRSSAGEDPNPKALSPAEARDHVGETRTVEMTVESSKNASPRREYYLDSEEDFRAEKNLAVVISYDHADAFRRKGIDDPAEYYRGKRIRVTGELIREADQLRIRVEAPERITLVDKD